jgi:hypothetical protein
VASLLLNNGVNVELGRNLDCGFLDSGVYQRVLWGLGEMRGDVGEE